MSEIPDHAAEFVRQKLEERDRLRDLDILDREHESALRCAIRSHAYDHGIIIKEGEYVQEKGEYLPKVSMKTYDADEEADKKRKRIRRD